MWCTGGAPKGSIGHIRHGFFSFTAKCFATNGCRRVWRGGVGASLKARLSWCSQSWGPGVMSLVHARYPRPSVSSPGARGPAPGKPACYIIWCNTISHKHVLEFGTNLGIASGYMAAALPKTATLTTVEGVPALAACARRHLKTLGVQAQVTQVQSTFEAYLDHLPAQARFDLLYIDGDHTHAATVGNITRLKAHMPPGALVVVDDIYWSPDMTRAWQALCADDDFTVSADLFRLGLLYYRVQQTPQHFILKP